MMEMEQFIYNFAMIGFVAVAIAGLVGLGISLLYGLLKRF
jgi:hypothetical protein